MSKNIALFIDGTWNEPVHGWRTSNTNVRKLHLAAENQPDQVCCYLRGIGTDPAWVEWLRKVTPANLAGGAFGFGMSARIKDAYRFLSLNYEKGDHVYLFGFSRGAFAARSVAGFVDAVGLLLKRYAHDENLIEAAYALYENGVDAQHSALRGYLRELGFPSAPSAEDGTDLPIYFIGVWDTVAALGLPGRLARFSAPFTEFHQTQVPSNVSFARHGLALHELREKFPALLWHDTRYRAGSSDPSSPPRVQQMWFPGAHSNVGGGYAVAQWSDATLDWMAGEAKSFGLRLRSWPRTPAPGRPLAMIENSLSGIFAASPPAIRAPLRNPLGVDTGTASTFDVHPFAAQRLFDDGQLAYAFPGHVNDALSGVDWCTVRLIHSLGIPGRVYHEAVVTAAALVGSAPDADTCRAGLRSFANAAGGVQDRDRRVFLRAFMRATFDSGSRRVVIGDLESLMNEVAASLRLAPDLGTARAFADRLVEITGAIRDVVGEFHPESGDPLDRFTNKVGELVSSLTASIRREDLRRKAPPHGGLHPHGP